MNAPQSDTPTIPDKPLFYVTLANQERLYEGELREIQIGLPCSAEAYQEALESIGIDGIRYTETMRLQDYSEIEGLGEAMEKVEDLDALNYAAHLIAKAAPDKDKYAAVLQHQQTPQADLAHYVNTAANLDAFRHEAAIHDKVALGRLLADESDLFFENDGTLFPEIMKRIQTLQACFDGEKFVRSHIAQHYGQFSEYGYVERKNPDVQLENVFSLTDPIPKAYRITKPPAPRREKTSQPVQVAR